MFDKKYKDLANLLCLSWPEANAAVGLLAISLEFDVKGVGAVHGLLSANQTGIEAQTPPVPSVAVVDAARSQSQRGRKRGFCSKNSLVILSETGLKVELSDQAVMPAHNPLMAGVVKRPSGFFPSSGFRSKQGAFYLTHLSIAETLSPELKR